MYAVIQNATNSAIVIQLQRKIPSFQRDHNATLEYSTI